MLMSEPVRITSRRTTGILAIAVVSSAAAASAVAYHSARGWLHLSAALLAVMFATSAVVGVVRLSRHHVAMEVDTNSITVGGRCFPRRDVDHIAVFSLAVGLAPRGDWIGVVLTPEGTERHKRDTTTRWTGVVAAVPMNTLAALPSQILGELESRGYTTVRHENRGFGLGHALRGRRPRDWPPSP